MSSELTSLGLEIGTPATYPNTLRSNAALLDGFFGTLATRRYVVDIAHADILTLPTTPVTLLAAAAAGTMRCIPMIAVESVFGAAAYTNVDAGAAFQLKEGTIAYGPTVAMSELVTTGADLVLPLDAKVTSTKANLTAKALTLTCANGALGAFTGGHPANVLRVTFWTADFATGGAKAYANIGGGANGTVYIAADATGTAGNSYTVEVVLPTGLSLAMSATLTGTAILVSLGTNGGGTADATKNTATLIAAAVDALAGVNAKASGTGVTALTGAEGPTAFADGV
jgi:hypothetical protein